MSPHDFAEVCRSCLQPTSCFKFHCWCQEIEPLALRLVAQGSYEHPT